MNLSKRTHQASKECSDPQNTSNMTRLDSKTCVVLYFSCSAYTAGPHSTLNSTLSHRYSNNLAQHRFCSCVLRCQKGPVRPPFLGPQDFFFLMDYLKPHSDRGPRFCSSLTALFGFSVCLPYPFPWLNKKYTDGGFTFDCEPCEVSEGSANTGVWYWV